MDMSERDAYIDFMCNINNAYDCDHCPECGRYPHRMSGNPCGQMHCWVEVHCLNGTDAIEKYPKEDEDD